MLLTSKYAFLPSNKFRENKSITLKMMNNDDDEEEFKLFYRIVSKVRDILTC